MMALQEKSWGSPKSGIISREPLKSEPSSMSVQLVGVEIEISIQSGPKYPWNHVARGVKKTTCESLWIWIRPSTQEQAVGQSRDSDRVHQWVQALSRARPRPGGAHIHSLFVVSSYELTLFVFLVSVTWHHIITVSYSPAVIKNQKIFNIFSILLHLPSLPFHSYCFVSLDLSFINWHLYSSSLQRASSPSVINTFYFLSYLVSPGEIWLSMKH